MEGQLAWKFISHQKKLQFRKRKWRDQAPPLTLPPPLLGAWVLLSLFIPEEEAIKWYLI